ncbi:hypothetical protein BH20ACT11_BH20ACT11_04820 [soil metagenome]
MTTQRSTAFGPVLRRYRAAVGLTQEDLAVRAGLGSRTVSDLERGVSKAPYQETVRRLVDALGLSEDGRAELSASARPPEEPPADGPRLGRPTVEGGFLGAVPAASLVAREEELGRVLGALEEVAGGLGRMVLVAGEPGVGKTRLAQEVSIHAWESGFLVAAGRCYEAQSGVPFYPFLEALGSLYEQTSPGLREEAPRRWPYLPRLLPDHFSAEPATASGSPEEIQRLLRAVTGFVREASLVSPVAVMLDDLHWADGASLELLQHLARHTRGERVMIVGLYRDTDAGRSHPLRRAARELGREQLLEKVALGRLGRRETADLVSDRLDGAEVSAELSELLHDRTGGNPFFTVEVVRDLIERGDLFSWEGRWLRREIHEIEVPHTVSETISERVSRLSPRARESLEQASVLGQTFGSEHLRSVSDLDEDQVESALEEAASAGIVQAVDDVHTFNHPLIRQTLYEELLPGRRRRLHRTAGESLEGLPEWGRRKGAADLVRHFTEGGAPGRALPYAMLAGEEAEAVFACGEAESYYRAALRLAGEAGEPRRGPAEAGALERLGGVLAVTVRHDETVATLEKAAEEYREAGDEEGSGRVEARIAQTHFRRGTPDEGITRLSQYLSSLDRPGASEGMRRSLAALYCGLARLQFALKQFRACHDATERAAELSREVGDERLLADAEMTRGTVLLWLDAPEEAVTVLENGASLAEESGALDILVLVLFSLHRAYLTCGQLDRSRECGERGMALAEKAGDTDALALHTSNVGLGLFYLGDWHKARVNLERGVELVRDAPPSFYSGWPDAYLGVLCVAEGRWEEASRHLSDGVTIAQRAHNVGVLRYLQTRMAELDVLRGRPQQAISRLEPHLDAPDLTWMYDALLFSVLAEAYLETGDVARARDVAGRAVARARTMHNLVDGVDAQRVEGKVLSRQGRQKEANATLERALSRARSIPYPYAEAKILHEYGVLHALQGEPGQARERHSAALGIFRRLGASEDAGRTEQALQKLE